MNIPIRAHIRSKQNAWSIEMEKAFELVLNIYANGLKQYYKYQKTIKKEPQTNKHLLCSKVARSTHHQLYATWFETIYAYKQQF